MLALTRLQMRHPVEAVPSELIRKFGSFLLPRVPRGIEQFHLDRSYFEGSYRTLEVDPQLAVFSERTRIRNAVILLRPTTISVNSLAKSMSDMAALLGRRDSNLSFRITTTDSEGILYSIFPHFAEGGDVPLPSRRQGSGLISLQTLILLMRFGQLRVAAGDGFMMVIEEPRTPRTSATSTETDSDDANDGYANHRHNLTRRQLPSISSSARNSNGCKLRRRAECESASKSALRGRRTKPDTKPSAIQSSTRRSTR